MFAPLLSAFFFTYGTIALDIKTSSCTRTNLEGSVCVPCVPVYSDITEYLINIICTPHFYIC